MILALLAAQFGAAQGDIVVYEGATTSHNVTNHPGNSYVWGMYKDFSPDVEADPLEYEFISPPNVNTVKVKWRLPGLYYLKITEVDPNSCSNVKVLPVIVLPADRTIGFETIASNSCAHINQNGFSLDVKVLDDSGVPLGDEYYPLNVNFMFNSEAYSQVLNSSGQTLDIKEEWILIDPGITNTFEIQITGASDVNDKQILPQAGMDLHTRTIFAIPVITFTNDNVKITQGLHYVHEIQLATGEPIDAKYSWMVIPPEGTSTDLSLIQEDSAKIFWDGDPGTYLVQAFITDGNGCVSDTIIQNVEILDPGELVFSSLYPGTITCSDLEGGMNGTVPESSESQFRISYDGEANLLSAKITIKNPNGKYVGLDGIELSDQLNPEVEINNPDVGKEITFVVTDSWENNSSENVEFEIQLINGITSDQLEIQAVDGTDINRTVTVLTKPVIEFN